MPAYQPRVFSARSPPPRAVSTALHRDEGAAHVSDGHRRAMPPNVGALPPTASSSVGRAAGFTPRRAGCDAAIWGIMDRRSGNTSWQVAEMRVDA